METDKATVTVNRLSTGFYHVRGSGPCNWAQLPHWPATEREIRAHSFPEASETFIRQAVRAAYEHSGMPEGRG